MFDFLKKKISESIGKIAGRAGERAPGEQTEKKPGVVEKIVKRVTETTLSEGDVSGVVKDLRTGLLESDVAFEVAEKISTDLKRGLVGKSVSRGKETEAVREVFRASLEDALRQEDIDFVESIRAAKKEKGAALVLFIGFNGAGKTTTLAKIASLLMNKGLSCVFAAGDTWRAASIEQLEIHASRLGCRVVKHKYGSDSAAVIFDALAYAKANGADVVLADTAGRSHTNINLVDELKKVCRVNKPDFKILVLDSLTGSDIYDQSKFFNEAVDVDGIVLTKADVYEKGGAALSVAHTIKKPVLFLGVGQDYGDLVEYDYTTVVGGLISQDKSMS